MEGVDNAEGKQKILVELYDNFFAAAFSKTVDKLGIVYTPIEIVDFMLRSADAVLQAEFGQSLTDENVHILDGFTGTGTFLVRLLQSGLIKPEDLARKYANELHANEILLLAYYIACVNIETTYQELAGEAKAFEGLILTDTFQSWEPDDRLDLEIFKDNNARLEALKKLPITVILGNPPYSSGQDSANDNNANESYPALDSEIRMTYAETSTATNKNSLYDSYIRAIKWATLRLDKKGVIVFITNGGFIDSNTADGMRKSLADEFSAIHIYNLRGNTRTSGEQARKEGGQIFGAGSRATIAITVLVRNPGKVGPATIHYTDIGDYLTREQKLGIVKETKDIHTLDSREITPNEYGDWINQRREDFGEFIAIEEVFGLYSGGVKTNRDAWCYNFSPTEVETNMRRLIDTYEGERKADKSSTDATTDPTKISWNRSLSADLDKKRVREFQPEAARIGAYRPFVKQSMYFSRELNDMVYRQFQIFPTTKHENQVLSILSPTSRTPFSLITNTMLPDNAMFMDPAQNFPRYRYELADEVGTLLTDTDTEVIDGYRKLDNITDAALTSFQSAYGDDGITKDDIFFYIYGLLHSPEYREAYAADLKRMLPRIPFVRDFTGYADAGRRLSDLHLNYESVDPYPLGGLDTKPEKGTDPYKFYAVGDKKMKFAKIGKEVDRTTLHYNDHITLTGIPEQAYGYQLGSRSAIEWLIDRYYIKTDKTSGIVNNPNDWSREINDPRYILDLIARVTTVSVETVAIVNALPVLDILEIASV